MFIYNYDAEHTFSQSTGTVNISTLILLALFSLHFFKPSERWEKIVVEIKFLR